MRFITVVLASALAAYASAQSNSTASSVPTTTGAPAVSQTQQMPAIATQGFDPNNVTDATKDSWCLAQENSCRAICQGVGTSENQCLTASLTYTCVCYNGTIPDCTRYTETLPFNICRETRAQCIRRNPDDQQAQDICDDNAQCGEILPPTIEAASPSSSSSSASGGGASPTSATGSASPAATTSPNAGIIYGAEVSTGAFAALLMAACQLLL